MLVVKHYLLMMHYFQFFLHHCCDFLCMNLFFQWPRPACTTRLAPSGFAELCCTPRFKIFVRTLAVDGPKIVRGETITLTVQASDTIDNVEIARVTCWPTSSQRLMFATLVLQDGTVAADSTVPDLLPVTVSQVEWPFEAFNEGCNVSHTFRNDQEVGISWHRGQVVWVSNNNVPIVLTSMYGVLMLPNRRSVQFCYLPGDNPRTCCHPARAQHLRVWHI